MCFQAGYNVRGHRFMSNITYILLYGIIGTLISMVLFTIGLKLLDEIFHFEPVLNLDQYHMLMLASLLSNWETHSCVLILDEKKYPTLTSLMFGETMINDGVVIALFNAIHRLENELKANEPITDMYKEMLKELVIVSSSSIGIGIGVALLMCFIMRQMRDILKGNHYVQMLFVLVSGYLSFMISEMSNSAGGLTIFCAGFVLSYYAFNSMTEKGRTLTKVTVHFLSFIPESFIFAYIGLTVPSYFIGNAKEFYWLAAIIVGSFYIRAIMIYFLYFIGALIQRSISSYSFRSTTMLMLGGMIRGNINGKHRVNSFCSCYDSTTTRCTQKR